MTFSKLIRQSQNRQTQAGVYYYYFFIAYLKKKLGFASVETKWMNDPRKFSFSLCILRDNNNMTVFNVKSVYFCKWSAARSVFTLKIVCQYQSNTKPTTTTEASNKSLVITGRWAERMMEETSTLVRLN